MSRGIVRAFALTMLAALAAVVACKTAPGPVTPDAADGGGIVIVDVDGGACAAACARLGALGCPEAKTTDGGTTCADLCERTQAGAMVDLHPECVAGAADVAAVKRCGVRCQ